MLIVLLSIHFIRRRKFVQFRNGFGIDTTQIFNVSYNFGLACSTSICTTTIALIVSEWRNEIWYGYGIRRICPQKYEYRLYWFSYEYRGFGDCSDKFRKWGCMKNQAPIFCIPLIVSSLQYTDLALISYVCNKWAFLQLLQQNEK